MNVYLSHSASSQLGALRDLLHREGTSFRDSFDLSAGSNISERVFAEIQAADAVIAVISQDAANVFFEIGVAIALHKPVLALLNPGTTAPSFIAPMTYLTSDLADSDVLRLGVKRFLDESKERPPKVRQTRKEARLITRGPNSLQRIIEQLSHLRQAGNPSEVERRVAEIFRAAGITAVEEYKDAKDRGVDFAVWSDSLRSSLGNPVLIQVKVSKLNEMSFRVAYSRLAKQVQESGSAAGLLLYLDKSGKRFKKPATWIPSVLWFDVEDFANQLSGKSFAEVLVERRNRAVHGLVD
jgi:hypothetical protein